MDGGFETRAEGLLLAVQDSECMLWETNIYRPAGDQKKSNSLQDREDCVNKLRENERERASER